MNNPNAKVKKIKSDFDSIRKSIDLSEKENTLSSLKAKSTDPNLWDDADKARSLMQEIGNLESEINEVKQLEDEISILSTMADEGQLSDNFKKEVEEAEKKFKKFKLSSLLSDPYDRKNAIVSIHAGQGGTEAMDWTSMLYRMYLRYCEKRGWKTEILDLSEGEEAGIKSVSFEAEGDYAFGYLKAESGTHRLVRQSPFNADKLRQTSFALVEILPDLEEVDLPDIAISEEDLEWQFFRASTQGGQNVQKVSTAVRLTHKPTGIVVTAHTERYQEQNRRYALNLLRAKLWALEQKKKEEKIEDIKGEYRPASWGTQIRSYVLHPYKMVKDLRTDVKSSDPESILDGNLDGFIEAELKLSK